jgi:hypothetical protein
LYSQFTTRFAAYDNVEMERARSELQMHRAVCTIEITLSAALAARTIAPNRSILATRG